MQPGNRLRRPVPTAALSAVLVLAAGCGPGAGDAGASLDPGSGPEAGQGSDDGHGPAAADAGAAYVGMVDVEVVPAGDAGAVRRDSGSGSARFVEQDGKRTQLAVVGSIQAPADAGFVINGAEDGGIWTGREGDVTLTFGPGGRIDGGGVVDGQRLRFDGAVTADRFDLTVDLELLEDVAGGMPAGTRFAFHYDLRRRHSDDGHGGDSRRDRRRDGDCPRTVWRFRNVPSLSGGSMQMIQVPECVG